MAVKQGLNRLIKGFAKKLTKSEVSRGYLFVSKDRKILELKELEVVINKQGFGKRKLDSYGRISISKDVTSKIGQNTCHFKLEGRVLQLEF